MKKLAKSLSMAIAAVLAVVMCVALIGCDGGGAETKAKKVTGVYTSNSISFMSAYPTFTYKQLTVASQTLTIYDDGTYCLADTSNMISGALNFPDVATEEDAVSYNNRGVQVTCYYGTYTVTEEEGLLDVALAKPTTVQFTSKINQQGHVNGFFDSDNWTEEMASLMATEDKDGNKVNMTKDAFLNGRAFNAVEVTVDAASGGFDYIALKVGA